MATTLNITPPARAVHPVWLRITHWLNALAAIVMMLSGWRIYDASPVFRQIVIPPSMFTTWPVA